MSDFREIFSRITTAIMTHLERHPTAVDTPSVIACCWIDPEAAVEDVQQALEYLEKAGLVKRRQTLHGRTLYGRSRPLSIEDPAELC